MLDDQRPTLTLTYPRAGVNPPMTRILVGLHDYNSGLDMDSFQVIADFPLAGSGVSFFSSQAVNAGLGVWLRL